MIASEITPAAARAQDMSLVASLISGITGLPADAVVEDADLIEDLYIDSVAKIELLVACESHFGVEIPDEAVAELHTVADILAYLEAHRTSS
jgi:acyl carrier protein